MKCKNCNEEVDDKTLTHWYDGPKKNGYGHIDLCCDCFDVSVGVPIKIINAERAKKGMPPIKKLVT